MNQSRQCRTIDNSNRWESEEGSIFPLGVTYVETEDSFNFALYSKHAHSVILDLYCEENLVTPHLSFSFDRFKNKSGPIWHCRIPGDQVGPGKYYAYQISGPAPEPGFEHHAFDSEKQILDPYARVVFFPEGFDRNAAIEPGSNAGRAPLGSLRDAKRFEWNNDRQTRHAADLIIYELHVRGFTNDSNSEIGDKQRGTFQGVIEKIPYLNELGITAVELMPIFQFDPQDGNYWGYMPLNFFSPHHNYSSLHADCSQHCEFREMAPHRGYGPANSA